MMANNVLFLSNIIFMAKLTAKARQVSMRA